MPRRRAIGWTQVGWGLLLLVPWILSCATPPEEGEVLPARVAVDVYGGIGGPNPPGPPAPRRVHLVMDVTPSMLEESPDGGRHIDAARGEAAQLLYSLREGTEIAISALGNVESERCVRPERIVSPVVPERQEPLLQRIEDLPPLSEGSLSAAIDAVRDDVVRDAAAARTRVVVFTDLDGSCGGDLCRAAEALVDAGAWLEIVTLGNAVPPACLADLRPSIAQPTADRLGLRGRPPSFRVERARQGRGRPEVLGRGYAGEGPVKVAAGLVTVVLDLDPPEEIGPFRVEPGAFARVRLLNAFDAALPTRVWRVERGTGPLNRAFPPRPASPSDSGGSAP
jgi:hypothetical protein